MLRCFDAVGFERRTRGARVFAGCAGCRPGDRARRGDLRRQVPAAMAYKLLTAAQARWRSVNAPHLVALAVWADRRGQCV